MTGSTPAPAVPRRSRWRAYLLLARVSNLPTVWSNVLAGLAAAGAASGWPGPFGEGSGVFLRLCLGVSLMYTAGMFLNDYSDEAFDRRHRPDRPLALGEVSRTEVLTAGSALLVGGIAVAAFGSSRVWPLVWLGALASAIVYYDRHHKQNPFGPFVMGLCRGLVYCVAAVVATDTVGTPVLAAAAGLTLYVAGLTIIARRLGPAGGAAVPLLLAGISLVDAVVVLACGGGPSLAGIAALGFPLTLAFQRLVPGT